MTTYQDFLINKNQNNKNAGFEPIELSDYLFDFQVELVRWAIEKGRAAIFADCGLGKTLMQLVWADNVVKKTNKPVLILTPSAVSFQTVREAEKFDIEAYLALTAPDNPNIRVINYEKLHYLSSDDYGGVVCDESSILKNFAGTRRVAITEFMRQLPYRLLCTATAAPNDWTELGTSSEALGYLGHTDMLTKFFTNKSNSIASRRFQNSKDKFHLREYAKSDFWRWVSSWARAVRKPSDLGFEDKGFVLPEMIEKNIEVAAVRPPSGALWDIEATNFHEEREAIKRTINERCETVASTVKDVSMVWCHLNDEARELKRIIPKELLSYKGYQGNQIENRYSHWIWRQYASSFWDDIRIDNVLPYKESKDEDDERHVHPLQLDVIRRVIHLYSNPGDRVLTPFMGVGSEVYEAVRAGRYGVGVELKPSYFKQALRNLAEAKLEEDEAAQLTMF